MVLNLKKLALAGAFTIVAAPAFAQVPPALNPLGVDLDPFHIFTPAPAAAPEAAPAAAGAPMMHHRMRHHHMMMHHHTMHKKMMHKKMMKKPMMKKGAEGKDMSKDAGKDSSKDTSK